MADRLERGNPPVNGMRSEGSNPEHGGPIWLYDPAALRRAIGDDEDDDGFVGPEDEQSPSAPLPRNTEEEVRAHRLRRILRDPRGATRPSLHGTQATIARLEAATASMRHFSAVTGIVERAVLQSAATGRPLAMPPILMVSEPGLGKTFYCRMVAQALRTTCIPISIAGTSDRGGLGGLSPVWRGAKPGKIANGLLVESATAAPIYLLDEIDKPPALVAGENTLDVLLAALEPENAAAFLDEYVDVPVDLRSALWLASANDASAIPAPLLDRMLVVDVPWPDRDGARVVAAAVAAGVLNRTGFEAVADGAVDAILHLSPRRMRRVLELACGFAAAERHFTVMREDVRDALDLVVRDRRRRVGFLSARTGEVR